MVLNQSQVKQVDSMLSKQHYWNIIIAPDGTDNSYPIYSKIAADVGCYEEDVKEYKDLVFGTETPGISR
ncbi:MAG: hypothetical protein GOV02_01635 [Candidatus Aenigmarchaeota archaeon]|nr:hypothetical protein [Candidatus Aenigmarchaeota archaeon]